MFTQALSIHLASGSLIKGKAGVIRRCSAEQKLRHTSKTRFGTKARGRLRSAHAGSGRKMDGGDSRNRPRAAGTSLRH